MNKKSIILLTSTLAIASLGFYFYKKRQTRIVYEKSVKEITKDYQVFFYILPIMLVLCVYFYINHENSFNIKSSLFYSVLFCFLIFTLLSKINSFPFSDSYTLLNSNFLFFTSLFRDGTRYYSVIQVLYIFFISLFFYYIKERKYIFNFFIILYFLASTYYIQVSFNIRLQNDLEELNKNLSSVFSYNKPYTILSFDNGFNNKLYPGNSNSRVILFDIFIDRYRFND
jgi:hypothetical protein